MVTSPRAEARADVECLALLNEQLQEFDRIHAEIQAQDERRRIADTDEFRAETRKTLRHIQEDMAVFRGMLQRVLLEMQHQEDTLKAELRIHRLEMENFLLRKVLQPPADSE